jgi:hypothetical protein
MLSEENRLQLLKIFVGGVLVTEQTDELIHATWRKQTGVCPVCYEEHPWHRGVVFQFDAYPTWVCMVCAVSFKATTAQRESRRRVQQPKASIPTPPGFELVWVRTSWLPRLPADPAITSIRVAKGLGVESAPVVRAAIVEDPNVARITRPKDYDPESDAWLPYLLKGKVHRKDSSLLPSYVGTDEELVTTEFIHEQLGLEIGAFESLEIDMEHGPTTLPYVEGDRLHQVHAMSPAERCHLVPRCGLVERDVWEAMPKTDFDGLGLALKLPLPEGLMMYFLPYHSCPHFYRVAGHLPWLSGPDDLADKVGFHLGRFWNPWDMESAPLWERVFGDALVPGLPPDLVDET